MMLARSVARNASRKLFTPFIRAYAVRDNVSLGHDVHIGVGTTIEAPNSLTVGNNVYFGKRCTIECDGAIGNDVLIANQVGLIGRHDHDYRVVGVPIPNAPWIGKSDYHGKGEGLRLIVGDDVWLGFGSVVLTGLRVGRGAIIGAGSVVTTDVPSYAIVVGHPARVIGSRFDSSDMALHEALLYGSRSSEAKSE